MSSAICSNLDRSKILLSGNGLSPLNCPSATSKNVALNKTARQSSLMQRKGEADHAVDGNRSQMYGDGSCTHTRDEYNPFWEVDLAEIYFIDEIIIYPRWDCCRKCKRSISLTKRGLVHPHDTLYEKKSLQISKIQFVQQSTKS